MPESERSLKRAFTDENSDLREMVFEYARERLQLNPPPLDGSATPETLQERTGNTITEAGLGGAKALNLFANSAATATISVLAFGDESPVATLQVRATSIASATFSRRNFA